MVVSLISVSRKYGIGDAAFNPLAAVSTFWWWMIRFFFAWAFARQQKPGSNSTKKEIILACF